MSELALYQRALSQALNCPERQRRKLLERTERMAQDFVAGKPDATWDEVEAFLGDPRELAQTMLESMDQKELTRYRKKKLYFKRVIIGILVAVLILISCGLIYLEKTVKIPVKLIEISTSVTEK